MVSSTIFWVFGRTQPGIELQSLRPLANTLLIRPMLKCTTILNLFVYRIVTDKLTITWHLLSGWGREKISLMAKLWVVEYIIWEFIFKNSFIWPKDWTLISTMNPGYSELGRNGNLEIKASPSDTIKSYLEPTLQMKQITETCSYLHCECKFYISIYYILSTLVRNGFL